MNERPFYYVKGGRHGNDTKERIPDAAADKLLHSGIDNKTLDSLKKGKNITMITLEKLCRICDCTPDQVVRFR